MIVKMKKISIVVLDSERKEALKKLRSAGVVHLETVQGKGSALSAFKEANAKTENALGILEEIKLPKKTVLTPVDVTEKEKVLEKCNQILELSSRKKSLFDLISADTQEIERLNAWGKITPADFEYLSEKKIYLSMYEIPSEKYNNIPETVKTVIVNTSKNLTRFLLVRENAEMERPKDLPPEAFEVTLPEKSSADLEKEIENAKNEISSIEKELISNTAYKASIKNYQKLLSSDIEFEIVYSGMGREADDANSTEIAEDADNSLAWLTGYVPVDSFDKFNSVAVQNNWAYASDDPADDDPVPTKLKNNKLVSLIYPLTDFLGTVPGYREFDISGWFLFFFTIFFGMIFGDGGYGLLITLGVLFIIIGTKIKGKKVHPMLGLVLLVGLATVVWGIVTCTWFGMSADLLRKIGLGFLPEISVPILSNAYSETAPGVAKLWQFPWNAPGTGLTTSQITQIFCFVLALLQLSIAHLKCCVADRKSLKILGDLGSLMQLWGMFYVVLMMVISTELFPMKAFLLFNAIPIGYFCIGILAVGFVLSFIFSNYDGSIKDSIIASCKNIISVILGVVNVFSDILSYVRLWAVGLAGSAISGTVNSMASQILGSAAGPIVAHAVFFLLVVVLLVFGHGLNMILNVLSVLVHGVRLNTLEFSSHMGMEWSGIKYEPFKEK